MLMTAQATGHSGAAILGGTTLSAAFTRCRQ
jgi:hypothetical protein